MDVFNPDIWKTALIQDWLAILVVWIVLFFSSVYVGSMLIRRWRRIAKSKKAMFHFETYERGTFWTKEPLGPEEVIQVRGVWHVTNVSFRTTALTHFRLRGVSTEHHFLAVRGLDNSEFLLLPDVKYDIEIYCVITEAKHRPLKPFRADVCFKDGDGNEHRVRRVPFKYRTFAGISLEAAVNQASRDVR
jgi:hypothetical protein